MNRSFCLTIEDEVWTYRLQDRDLQIAGPAGYGTKAIPLHEVAGMSLIEWTAREARATRVSSKRVSELVRILFKEAWLH